MTITSQQIMGKLMEQPDYRMYPPNMVAAMTGYLDQFLANASDILTKPVTLDILWEAKVRFLHIVVGSDFAELAAAMYPEMVDAKDIQEVLEGAVSEAEKLAGHLSELLAKQGLTDQDVLTMAKNPMKPELLEKYQARTLTLEDVLREQPELVTQNT